MWCCYIHFPLHLQLIWSCLELPFLDRGFCTNVERFLLQAARLERLWEHHPSLPAKTVLLFDRQSQYHFNKLAHLNCDI